MEKLPVEILTCIIKLLKMEDLKSCRLVNSLWRSIAVEPIRKLTKVGMDHRDLLVWFTNSFKMWNRHLFPFANFEMNQAILWRCDSDTLEEFCEVFDSFITGYKLDARCWVFDNLDRLSQERQDIISKNMEIILNNAENLRELTLFLPKFEFDHLWIHVPAFTHLRHIDITYRHNSAEDQEKVMTRPCFLSELGRQAPNLEKLDITNPSPTRLLRVLRSFASTNPNVAVCLFKFHLKASQNEVLSEMINIPFPNLFLLRLTIHREDTNDVRDSEFMRLLFQLLSVKRETLQAIRVDEESTQEHKLKIRLPVFPSLLSFNSNLQLDPILPQQIPVVYSLHVSDLAAFRSCILPTVTEATLDVQTQEERERWPSILPNLKTLDVFGPAYDVAFRFPQLIKLKIWEPTTSSKSEWELLTGGATPIPIETVSTVVLEPVSGIDGIILEPQPSYSFQNLKCLEELSLCDGTVDTVRAITYATRLGHLGRLKKLTIETDDEIPPDCIDCLEAHHDVLELPSTEASECASSDDGRLNRFGGEDP